MTWKRAIVGVCIVAASIGLFSFSPMFMDWLRPKVVTPPGSVSGSGNADALCQYVVGVGLRCVSLLGAESLLGPGAIVDYAANSDASAPVPLPNGALFTRSCIVPGEHIDALLESLKGEQNTVQIPTLEYKLDRKLTAGLELPIPKMPDVVLKAGPKWSEVASVSLVAPSAWVKLVDENLFLDSLESFGIRTACIERIIAAQYQVVSKALVVKDLRYDLSDAQGQSFGLDAAIAKGVVDATSASAARTIAQSPVVLGVQFMNRELFANRAKLKEPVLFSGSGSVSGGLTGGGGSGQLPSRSTTEGFNEELRLRSDGSESSECESGFEVTRSYGELSAAIRPREANELVFTASGGVRGGHYATGNCVFGKLVNISGHDTAGALQYSMTGSVRVTVRSDSLKTMQVTHEGLPAKSRISVRGPDGQVLNPSGGAEQTNVAGNGTLNYSPVGAGVYVVELLVQNAASVSGASSAPIADKGSLAVSVR